MNWKAWLPLAAAIVLGLIAARMAMSVISSQPAEQQSTAHLTPIVVAAGEIDPGTTLTAEHLKLGKVDAADMPIGAFLTPDQLINRVTKVSLSPNQPLFASLLAEEGSGMGVGATLPKGMRAITLEINDVSGVAGFIQPTCKVDVVGTIQSDGKPLSKTVLENILVFAVGGRTGPAVPPQPGQPVEQARTITLLCTPEQAEKLELATSSTRVRLVLRNGKDTSTSQSDGITIAELKGNADTSGDPFAEAGTQNTSFTPATTQPTSISQSPQQKQNWTVEIIKAGQQSTQTFEIQPKAPKKQEPKSEFDSIFSGVDTNK